MGHSLCEFMYDLYTAEFYRTNAICSFYCRWQFGTIFILFTHNEVRKELRGVRWWVTGIQ